MADVQGKAAARGLEAELEPARELEVVRPTVVVPCFAFFGFLEVRFVYLVGVDSVGLYCVTQAVFPVVLWEQVAVPGAPPQEELEQVSQFFEAVSAFGWGFGLP